MTLETCVGDGYNTQGGSHPADKRIEKNTEELTVCFVCLVEDILLKVLLLLHGGVKLRVIVLEQTDSASGLLCIIFIDR